MTSVRTASAVQDRLRRLPAPLRGVLVVVLLYVFLVGVGLIEDGIGAFGQGFTDGLLANVANPVSGLFAGLLATVLVQSSSVSTATIVGLVGAGTLSVELAVPMVMGANIGTTVTSTVAALGSIRRSEEFRRGFAAATVHDFFNLTIVVVLFPLELATGVLSRTAAALTGVLRGTEVREPGDSLLRTAIDVPVDAIGALTGESGAIAGALLLVVGLGCILLALSQITRTMRDLVAGTLERTMNGIIARGGGVMGILVGLVITVVVQSSTITTSILVPLVAAGVLTLQNAYPITLGANVGTTLTALIASLAVLRPEGLTIALVHALYNLAGLAIVYPFPAIRRIPVVAAERFAVIATERKSIVAIYLIGAFIVIPLAGLLLLPG